MNNKILTSFGFIKMPFTKNIEVKDIFKSNMIDGLLGMFELGISTEDIMLLYGDIGCGKSVALRLFLDSLDTNKYYPLYLKSGKMKTSHLYSAILDGMKVNPPYRLHDAKRLYEKVIFEFRKKPVIILDDAQELNDDAILELKNLVSFDVDSKNRLCVILSGQSEIANKLNFSLFAPLMQRIRLIYQAQSMNLEETCRYIDHQLNACGKETAIFTDDAKAEIFKRSNGIPRLVNKECFMALIVACTENREIIELSILSSSGSNK
ncbi:MAG: AAA family ATPase [Proteobacteria bacterium]|nr:AAA family ATPase [Pseudomonadota bacterium]